jgi:murein DD-endopeptidase MepM/ murein hydrolase activator NlpD
VRGLAVLVAAGVVALLVPAFARAYGWPIAPFDRQHPVRGAFDDPRLHIAADGTEKASFHFGIDIPAVGGTPVFSVSPGTVFRERDAVAVREPDGREFSYWHVHAIVREHQRVEEHQLLGWVKPIWGHLHFAESYRGTYLNPLRRGGLEPYVDTTTPVVAGIEALGPDGERDPTRVTGTVGLVADVFDPATAPLPPPPWQESRLMPALVRWRLLRGRAVLRPWTTVVDFRRDLLPPSDFDLVYDARGTWQNKPDRPGRYLVWLDRALDTAALGAGSYRIDVRASDLGGNTTTESFWIVVEP